MTGREEIEDTIRQLMVRAQVQEIMADACVWAGDRTFAAIYGNRAKTHLQLAKQLTDAMNHPSQH